MRSCLSYWTDGDVLVRAPPRDLRLYAGIDQVGSPRAAAAVKRAEHVRAGGDEVVELTQTGSPSGRVRALNVAADVALTEIVVSATGRKNS